MSRRITIRLDDEVYTRLLSVALAIERETETPLDVSRVVREAIAHYLLPPWRLTLSQMARDHSVTGTVKAVSGQRDTRRKH